MDATFKTFLPCDTQDQALGATENCEEPAREAFAARLVVTPTFNAHSKHQIIIDLAHQIHESYRVHLTPSLSFRALISDDSEVFKIVTKGSVKQIVSLLRRGAASLRDCDTTGRSLLNVSDCSHERPSCKSAANCFKVCLNSSSAKDDGIFDPERSGCRLTRAYLQ